MANTIIRAATADDIDRLTALKVRWADRAEEPSPAGEQEFSRRLAEWIGARPDRLVVRVAEADHDLVGMAWLVVFERVPDIDDHVRLTGDIQSVFVLPGHRRHGIGRALVAALLAAADEMAIARVTVSANDDAAALYIDAGFTPNQNLLERRLHGRGDR